MATKAKPNKKKAKMLKMAVERLLKIKTGEITFRDILQPFRLQQESQEGPKGSKRVSSRDPFND